MLLKSFSLNLFYYNAFMYLFPKWIKKCALDRGLHRFQTYLYSITLAKWSN